MNTDRDRWFYTQDMMGNRLLINIDPEEILDMTHKIITIF